MRAKNKSYRRKGKRTLFSLMMSLNAVNSSNNYLSKIKLITRIICHGYCLACIPINLQSEWNIKVWKLSVFFQKNKKQNYLLNKNGKYYVVIRDDKVIKSHNPAQFEVSVLFGYLPARFFFFFLSSFLGNNESFPTPQHRSRCYYVLATERHCSI